MTEGEILQLGRLARIRLNEEEVHSFNTEIEAILSYVGQINSLVAPSAVEKKAGAVHNVLREDEVTNTPGMYTKVLLAEMPDTKGEFLRVQKILGTTD